MQEQQTIAQQPRQVGIATKSLSQGSAGIDKALRMRALGGSAVGSAVVWNDGGHRLRPAVLPER
jgi:hypothetical protein